MTAEGLASEFNNEFAKYYQDFDENYIDIESRVAEKIIKFAKHHVELALKSAYNKAQSKYFPLQEKYILKSYPIENIK